MAIIFFIISPRCYFQVTEVGSYSKLVIQFGKMQQNHISLRNRTILTYVITINRVDYVPVSFCLHRKQYKTIPEISKVMLSGSDSFTESCSTIMIPLTLTCFHIVILKVFYTFNYFYNCCYNQQYLLCISLFVINTQKPIIFSFPRLCFVNQIITV